MSPIGQWPISRCWFTITWSPYVREDLLPAEQTAGYERIGPILTTFEGILVLLGEIWEPKESRRISFNRIHNSVRTQNYLTAHHQRQALSSLLFSAPRELAEYVASICGQEDMVTRPYQVEDA